MPAVPRNATQYMSSRPHSRFRSLPHPNPQCRDHHTPPTPSGGHHPSLRTILPSSSILSLPSVSSVRQWRLSVKSPSLSAGQLDRGEHTPSSTSIALVPTMGALHEGHLSLVRHAARACPHVLVSIFLNPAQFGRHEDLGSYPVTSAADLAALASLDRELARKCGTEYAGRISGVFSPSVQEMYPSGYPGQEVDSTGSFVTITPVGYLLEGAARPTFFRGVATVVMKLLNATQPDQMYLGQKDIQQTVVLRRMVRDFLVPTEVVVSPTVRDPGDGLALSSRNVYLGQRRRRVAPVLRRALVAARETYEAGSTQRAAILGAAESLIRGVQEEQAVLPPSQRVRFEVGYISLADPDTMVEVDEVGERGAVLSGAIKMLTVEEATEKEDLGHEGGPAVRLLDNIILGTRKI